jgi:hypothetical protein
VRKRVKILNCYAVRRFVHFVLFSADGECNRLCYTKENKRNLNCKLQRKGYIGEKY